MVARYEGELDPEEMATEVDQDEDERFQPFSEVALAEAALERTRERVERSVTALRAAVARRTDWRAWVARQPTLFLGAAMLFGFMWGFRHRGGRASHRR